jgi:hypothetical protein
MSEKVADIKIVYGDPFRQSNNTVIALTKRGVEFLKCGSLLLSNGNTDTKAFHLRQNAERRGLRVITEEKRGICGDCGKQTDSESIICDDCQDYMNYRLL